jgi:hypothetical protein
MKVYVILNRSFGINHVDSIWFNKKNAEAKLKEYEDSFIGDTSGSRFPYTLGEISTSDDLISNSDEQFDSSKEDIKSW